jgi:hypothetical protein
LLIKKQDRAFDFINKSYNIKAAKGNIMNKQMKISSKPIQIFVVGLIAVCIVVQTQAGMENTNQEQSVQIGQWTITSNSIETYDDPVWRGMAVKSDSNRVQISIYKNPSKQNSFTGVKKAESSVNSSGIGEALFSAEELPDLRQAPESPTDVSLRHLLICTLNQQKITFERTVEYSRKSGTLDTKGQFVQDSIAKALSGASSDPLISFAQLFFSNRIELGKCGITKDYPVVEAAIDSNQYAQLKRSAIFKNGDYGWNLPAKPGQSIKFRIHFLTQGIIATTRGIEISDGNELLSGRKISIDNKESLFDNKGTAQLEYGNIRGPDMLVMKYQGWNSNYRIFTGNIFLRWGRPEETWLANNYFPLAQRLSNPTTEGCINNILYDINIAFDWDRNCWIESQGDFVNKYYADWSDISAMEGLDLKEFPQLKSLDKKQVLDKWMKLHFEDVLIKTPYQNTGKITRNEVQIIQDNLVNPKYGRKLWEAISGFPGSNGPSGWHNPFEVYMLAYFWSEFPELRSDNPLEKVLDFWVKAIKENPDPVNYAYKTFTAVDMNLYSRGYAIAALHLGYTLFNKTEYKEARDIQKKQFLIYLQKKGFFDSIVKLKGWVDDPNQPNNWYNLRNCRQICEAVSLYGQTCVFTSDIEGLKQVQEWIKTALSGKGTEGQNPFRNYEAATFKDRCGFLSIMRGKSVFLSLPMVNERAIK